MKKLVTVALSLLPLAAASAQQLTPERQSAMLPFVARDRERAMNDAALCSGDLSIMQGKMADLQKQLADAKAEVEKLKADKAATP